MTMTGCSTDRNNGSGLSVTATGPGPLIVTGCMFRRDGKDSKGKGVSLSDTTMPVIINGMTVLPGVSDDKAPPDSPLIGLAVSGCAYVVVDNAYIHAVQTPISDGGSNGVFQQVGVYTATGPTTSPVRQAPAAVRTAVTLIAGTAAETAVHTFTVRANSALVGWMYKLVAWGTASGKGTATLTFRLRIGGPTGKIIGSVAVTAAAGASDRTWRMEGEVAVKGIGANANWHGVLTVLSDLAAAPVARSNASVDNTQVDTTVDQDLVLTVQWGTADAGNALYCPAAYAQRVMGS
jgi:hypothetical protein